MAAATANRKRYLRNIHAMQKGSAIQADSVTTYEGTGLVATSAGKATPGVSNVAGVATLGVACRKLASGAGNTTRVEFEYGHEEWFPHDGNLTVDDIGKNALWLDDQTLTNAATAAQDIPAGEIVEIATRDGVAGAWIRVRSFAATNA